MTAATQSAAATTARPRPARNSQIPGRETTLLPDPGEHVVLGTPLDGPWPEGTRVLYLAGGCFWGVERFPEGRA